MNDKIKELSEKRKFSRGSSKQKLKCDFQAASLTEFHDHLSAKHPVEATKGKLEYFSSKNSENSENWLL